MASDSGNLSMRQLAKELGVSQPFLSQIKAGKRPMPDSLREKVEALSAYHLLITDKQVGGYGGEASAIRATNSGAGDGIRTHDFLLGKHQDGIRNISYGSRCTSPLGNHSPLHKPSRKVYSNNDSV